MTDRAAGLRALTIALTLACGFALAAPATGAAANLWTTPPNQFLNMAHQGGELEVPGNTLYAFETALADRGADLVEMDAYISSDGELVVSHDPTLYGTTSFGTPDAPAPFDAPGASDKIWDYTVADLKKLDAAYWFVPGKGQYDHDPGLPHPFRGVATGAVQPPSGYAANDFTIPTFKEVLAALPAGTRINIEVKDISGYTAKGVEAAQELAAILAAQPGGDDENVLVSSFKQDEIDAFHAALPGHDSLGGSLSATSDYVFGNVPFNPQVQALQPPDKFELSPGTVIDAPEVIKAVLDSRPGADYAIHAWGADGTVENDALYSRLVDAGIQGYFAQKPSELTAFLCANHVPDVTGERRCTQPIPQLGKLTARGRTRAGEKAKIRGSISNAGDRTLANVSACIDISKRQRKALRSKCVDVGEVAPGASAAFTITVRTKKRAKGAYRLAVSVSSDNGGLLTGTVKLRVKGKRGASGDKRPMEALGR